MGKAYKIKFETVEAVHKDTEAVLAVGTRTGEATVEEITKLLNSPCVVKLTAKKVGYKFGKPLPKE